MVDTPQGCTNREVVGGESILAACPLLMHIQYLCYISSLSSIIFPDVLPALDSCVDTVTFTLLSTQSALYWFIGLGLRG